MELFENNAFIPIQKEGKELDIEHSITKETVPAAIALYTMACKRLLHPFLWHELTGKGTASFAIYEKGATDNRAVEIMDRLYIDVPGDVLKAEEHDWVIVEDIKKNIVSQADESTGLRLRACAHPDHSDNNTDHFFTEAATSTIIIKRVDNVVTASYHGRNEKPNIETGDLGTNVRNTIVALGAIIGLSKMQWKALLAGLLAEQE